MTNRYSLDVSWDLYHPFPLTICRPAYRGYLGEGKELAWVTVEWEAAWPAKEAFAPELLQGTDGPALLVPSPQPPAWAQREDYPAFLRLLGARTHGGAAFAGVLLERGDREGDELGNVLRACREGFDRAPLIARAADAPLIHRLRAEGMPFGLLLEAAEGMLTIRERLADLGLQRVWEQAPVFLDARGAREAPEELLRRAAAWHALASDLPGLKPGKAALRRLTYPQAVTTGGALPLRFWWQVVGDCPLYARSKVRLLLKNQEAQGEVPLGDERLLRPLGDHTHNEIASLPPLPAGEYGVWCGLFDENGLPLPLAMEEPMEQGFFKAGEITLDNEPRPEMLRAWESYEPEGYYPLEDPKLPY